MGYDVRAYLVVGCPVTEYNMDYWDIRQSDQITIVGVNSSSTEHEGQFVVFEDSIAEIFNDYRHISYHNLNLYGTKYAALLDTAGEGHLRNWAAFNDVKLSTAPDSFGVYVLCSGG